MTTQCCGVNKQQTNLFMKYCSCSFRLKIIYWWTLALNRLQITDGPTQIWYRLVTHDRARQCDAKTDSVAPDLGFIIWINKSVIGNNNISEFKSLVKWERKKNWLGPYPLVCCLYLNTKHVSSIKKRFLYIYFSYQRASPCV